METFDKIVQAAPHLAALVVVVVVMIRSRDRADDRTERITSNFTDTTKDVVGKFEALLSDAQKLQARSIEAAMNNTKALEDLRTEMRELPSGILRALNGMRPPGG